MTLEPKYKKGDSVKVQSWTKLTKELEILEIKKTWHRRIGEYVWGYKMDGETGLTMTYVPEGYLRPIT